ncbi:hypothetical protein [Alicyclobacillus kakegawensis]|uniref:hypothetical protein n=1 Tax=Alicyclobacillus kakegawensis TaxID=392012 RepID=UPI00082F085C|nr:hypothetical protein [Alicyclobacillus kakegawensis]
MGLLDNLTPKVPQREPLPNTNVQTAPAQVEDLKLSKALKEAAGQILAQMLLERASQQEQKVINTQGVMVDRRGYKYLSVFVLDDAQVTADVLGQQRSLMLRGMDWTGILVPDGSWLYSDTPILGVWWWANYIPLTSRLA